MTESTLLHWMRFQKNLDPCCPNTYTRSWFESDFVGVTRTDFWHEFEIKRSVADYRRDFKKGRQGEEFKGPYKWYPPYSEPKHVTLARKCDEGPNYFWFVVPEAVFEKIDEFPKYAGILIITKKHYRGISVERQAPRLHNKKVNVAFKMGLLHAIAFRYYRALNDIRDLKEQLERETVLFPKEEL